MKLHVLDTYAENNYIANKCKIWGSIEIKITLKLKLTFLRTDVDKFKGTSVLFIFYQPRYYATK